MGEELNYQGETQNLMKKQFEMWAVEQIPFLSGKEKAEYQEKEFLGEEFQYYDFFSLQNTSIEGRRAWGREK